MVIVALRLMALGSQESLAITDQATH